MSIQYSHGKWWVLNAALFLKKNFFSLPFLFVSNEMSQKLGNQQMLIVIWNGMTLVSNVSPIIECECVCVWFSNKIHVLHFTHIDTLLWYAYQNKLPWVAFDLSTFQRNCQRFFLFSCLCCYYCWIRWKIAYAYMNESSSSLSIM